ncbi:MAG: DNA-protecting protein DprA [Proteobacteria bacterium]|nr:DNA-protecting protein DprA [Pseudomonadota bacterium]
MELKTLTEAERLDWARLARTENVGPITFLQLIERYGSAGAALAALPDLARQAGRASPLRTPSRAALEAEATRLHGLGGRFLAICEPDYPVSLRAISDPPPVVSLLGDARLLERRAVAMVGARNASANGKRLARALASDLGAAGFAVVSGFARGIDAAAHAGALAQGTVAALAGGIDVIYPPENAGLYGEIKEKGLLVAESPLGTEPRASHFPRRNRVISGLSLGVVVIEAAERSGSLITARRALDQGREVFAVPGSPLDPRAKGCNQLLRQGATLVETAEDVLSVLTPMAKLGESHRPAPAPVPPKASDSEVSTGRARVLDLLGPNPVAVDELVRQCQLSAAIVLAVLLEAELAGRLERHPGNQVALRYHSD